MRVYYEDSYRFGYHHRHHRPNIEIDVISGWGGAYYPAPIARPEVVVVNQAPAYMPPPPPAPVAAPMMMPQPYGGMSVATAGYYQQQQLQQQTYQYQQPYSHTNNPPYPQW
ncbi:PREDICTED: small conductance calcium-activated potassium channel protein 3 [Drosophila arizonae]|uniref:Small conductance calcium-activated potassium channel protein 3 n=1 Tax=Drosophila arizonae TaxID=7263 RepID=A0ABM1NYM0_DROAR|nr:PREDICTED: small conductance calcium-activated potassium channel protein 3 [Drosophila arizonae]